MAKHTHKKLSKAKAKKILKDGMVRGKKLTSKQKGFFGFLAGGGVPTKLNEKKATGKFVKNLRKVGKKKK